MWNFVYIDVHYIHEASLCLYHNFTMRKWQWTRSWRSCWQRSGHDGVIELVLALSNWWTVRLFPPRASQTKGSYCKSNQLIRLCRIWSYVMMTRFGVPGGWGLNCRTFWMVQPCIGIARRTNKDQLGGRKSTVCEFGAMYHKISDLHKADQMRSEHQEGKVLRPWRWNHLWPTAVVDCYPLKYEVLLIVKLHLEWDKG